MAYQDKYEAYLDQIPADIEKCRADGKRHVFGYTSNYDVVLKWDVAVYNQILKEYLKDEPSAKAGDTMDTMEDFARISSYCLMKGIGANFDITNVEICEYLQSHFESEPALGGTCAQGAAALAAMGFPMVAQLTDKCREVCEMMDASDMRVVKGENLVPIMEGASDEPPVYHMILQFSKDDRIVIHGKEYAVPLSNRLILFYDKIHKTVPIDQCFFDYWNAHTDDISSYLAAGFDAVIDTGIMEERLDQLCRHFEIMRRKNPEFIFYFEGAFYMNPEVKEMIFRRLAPYANIFGSNEEELVAQNEKYGIETDITDIESVINGIEALLSRYGIRGMVLHTKDYSLYYGEELAGIDIEKGLTIGNLMSGTRARIGKYGSQDECRESLSLGLSPTGLAFHERLRELKPAKQAVLVPSRYLEHPKYTIGLGDTFVAGVHTCFE
ncbi:ADP-dependent glucokinase/phosphofructokinase [Lacrimispora sp. NSJ-141]|uniref:ADP-dependent glucokinase/phosphofructokinase n=1 Tax=Lientehia hominis TaxID=2897778 RepID=A0AAP2RIJ3_9FIRM|nr:ADP-dependent glucokinase/phosphofructokinase [Lientehia hominis]MCD2492109.1 ADP-dependent glucokinase/phosphofructokinase [Lientehia hominis]